MGKESAVSCEGWADGGVWRNKRPFNDIRHSILVYETAFYYRMLFGQQKELLDVLNLVEFGRLKPVVDSVFPLKEAATAQQKMLNRENFGKIVLKI